MVDRNYQTVSGVIGYDHPITRQIYHLVIHQSLIIPNLEHNLLCPMQACVNDATINEIPKYLAYNLTNETHSIIVTDTNETKQRMVIPLDVFKVTTYLPTRPITK